MPTIKALSSAAAGALDARLMGPTIGYTLEQLMELAGLAVAQAVARSTPTNTPVLVLCGPGNNGGDGLVAARHLALFGHPVAYCYPVRGKNTFYTNLEHQLAAFGIQSLDVDALEAAVSPNTLVLDALFGFSFRPPLREPFAQLMTRVLSWQQSGTKVWAVDVPSGWDVNDGPKGADPFLPQGLVSLTSPKPCTRFFKGVHFLGGRFVPPPLAAEYAIEDLAQLYQNQDQVVDISNYEIVL